MQIICSVFYALNAVAFNCEKNEFFKNGFHPPQ